MRFFRSRPYWLVAAGILLPAFAFSLRQEQTEDPVRLLSERVQADKTILNYDEAHGYLSAVLKELKVPVSSQTLVFSKSSFQLSQISPESPRAIYFNDDTYVGWVNHGQFLEIAHVDPKSGPSFYTVPQEYDPYPVFEHQTEECTVCHDTFQTSAPVPRLLMLSVLPNPDGNALKAASLITNDKSPLRERWGGWYVTGTHGAQRHLGNTIVRARADDIDDMRKFIGHMDLNAGANVTDLSKRFETKEYLSPYSDIVALMVLGHQTHVHNMITSGVYEIHDAIQQGLTAKMPEIIKDAGEPIVKTMLFSEEAPLTDPVTGSSGFAAEFTSRGPRDNKGRSLRDFDLKHRLMRYPLSYLVYSKSFDAMPVELKDYVVRRFREILTGQDTSPQFAHLSADDRQAILEILHDTKPGF